MDVGKSKIGDLDGNVAALIIYLGTFILGFIAPLVFMLVDKENQFIRYHAIQGLALTIAGMVIGALTCGIGLVVAYVFIVIAAIRSNKGEWYRAPVVGNLSAKWAGLPEAQ
jgi:uncharacterized membrane protein